MSLLVSYDRNNISSACALGIYFCICGIYIDSCPSQRGRLHLRIYIKATLYFSGFMQFRTIIFFFVAYGARASYIMRVYISMMR